MNLGDEQGAANVDDGQNDDGQNGDRKNDDRQLGDARQHGDKKHDIDRGNDRGNDAADVFASVGWGGGGIDLGRASDCPRFEFE
jgi:hypothetical protein